MTISGSGGSITLEDLTIKDFDITSGYNATGAGLYLSSTGTVTLNRIHFQNIGLDEGWNEGGLYTQPVVRVIDR